MLGHSETRFKYNRSKNIVKGSEFRPCTPTCRKVILEWDKFAVNGSSSV